MKKLVGIATVLVFAMALVVTQSESAMDALINFDFALACEKCMKAVNDFDFALACEKCMKSVNDFDFALACEKCMSSINESVGNLS